MPGRVLHNLHVLWALVLQHKPLGMRMGMELYPGNRCASRFSRTTSVCSHAK